MKNILVFFITAVILGTGVSVASERCDSVREAKKLLEFNHTSDAIACLEQDNLKTDTEANYLLGKIYFERGKHEAAKTRFSVGQVKNAYGESIYALYKSAADSNIAGDNFLQARSFLEEAVTYKPSVRVPVANEMFEKGKETGKRGYFFIARQLDPSMAPKIGDHFYALSKKPENAENQVELLEEASKNDEKHVKVYIQTKEQRGRGYLNMAKKFARSVGAEDLAAKYKTLARKDLGDAVVDQELPEERIYRSGTYTFTLKAGEQTESWITFPSGVISNWNLDSLDGKFQAVYADGEIVNIWSATSLPRNKYKFKLRAVADQSAITMVVRQR